MDSEQMGQALIRFNPQEILKQYVGFNNEVFTRDYFQGTQIESPNSGVFKVGKSHHSVLFSILIHNHFVGSIQTEIKQHGLKFTEGKKKSQINSEKNATMICVIKGFFSTHRNFKNCFFTKFFSHHF